MAIWLILLMILIPIILIVSISWIYKLMTGYDILGTYKDATYRREWNFFEMSNFYGKPNYHEHEQKDNPHYDAFVDAEWRASRPEDISDIPDEEDLNHVYSLRELLEKKDED